MKSISSASSSPAEGQEQKVQGVRGMIQRVLGPSAKESAKTEAQLFQSLLERVSSANTGDNTALIIQALSHQPGISAMLKNLLDPKISTVEAIGIAEQINAKYSYPPQDRFGKSYETGFNLPCGILRIRVFPEMGDILVFSVLGSPNKTQ